MTVRETGEKMENAVVSLFRKLRSKRKRLMSLGGLEKNTDVLYGISVPETGKMTAEFRSSVDSH